MNCYVDFDDCLCETGRAFSELARDLFGTDVSYEEMRYFNLRQAFHLNEEQYDLLLVKGHEPEALLSYTETPGASAVLNEWIREGHTVSVITGRPFSAWEVSREWLDRHGLQQAALYCLDKYGRETLMNNSEFCLQPEDFHRMEFGVAVEDSPLAFRFFDRWPALKVMVFDRPWNRDAEFPNSCYRRCFSWEDIRAAVRG